MILFSNTCQYAIKACIILAIEKKKVGIIDISGQIGTPTAFTSKILQSLAKSRLISSGKGRNGGFYLTEEQYELLTVKDIYENFEGKQVLSSCLLGLEKCDSETPCPIHNMAVEIKEKLMKMLECKIKDLQEFGSVTV